ncbi:MAG: hypothetical protein LKM39_15200 [Chiayiivirga sp.]|nr:hypothetical protein [Chiayiivirga sp.]
MFLIIGLATSFPADAVERQLPDVATAQRLVASKRPDFAELLALRRERLLRAFGTDLRAPLDRTERALTLGLARFGARHGSWGDDYHHYHNENHALEVLDGRLGRLMDQIGIEALAAEDWLACPCSAPAMTCASAKSSTSATRSATTRPRASPKPDASWPCRGSNRAATAACTWRWS